MDGELIVRVARILGKARAPSVVNDATTADELHRMFGFIIFNEAVVLVASMRKPTPDAAARRAVISWAGSDGFAAAHNTSATVEAITDDLLRFLWQAGFKIAPLDDGDWF